jgi:very-short-patch-repair endonuclease
MAARRFTLTDFIEQSKAKFGDKFIFKESVYLGSKKPITIKCKKHGEFETQPSYFLRSDTGCPGCGYKLTQADFILKSILKHGKRYNYDSVKFVNTTTKVEIVCKKHGSFKQEPYMHYHRGQGCPTCFQDRNGLTTEEYIYRAKKVHGEAYDYSKVKYKHNTKPIVIICKKHGEFKQLARSHVEGHGCNECFLISNRSNKAEFITKAIALHGNRYDYSKVVYRDSKQKVIVVCKQHGDFKLQPNMHLATRGGCPRCSESKGESRIRLYLAKIGVEFVQEYRIEPYRYRYDFYIPKVNLLIEFHGEQHYRPVSIFGGEAGYKKTVKRDKVKRELARRSGYQLMTTSYRSFKSDNLERIIKARLSCAGYPFKKSM